MFIAKSTQAMLVSLESEDEPNCDSVRTKGVVNSPHGHHLGSVGVHCGAHTIQHIVEGDIMKLLQFNA